MGSRASLLLWLKNDLRGQGKEVSLRFLWNLGGYGQGGASGKELACQCRRHKWCRFHPWVGKIPWRRKWQPTPVFLPGELHGQKSLVGYSPWGLRNRTWLSNFHFHFFRENVLELSITKEEALKPPCKFARMWGKRARGVWLKNCQQ